MVIVNILIRGINTIFSGVGFIIDLLLLLFPISPFHITLPAGVSVILAKANYFIPLNEMIAIGELWLAAITVFYMYSVYARWAKAIQ